MGLLYYLDDEKLTTEEIVEKTSKYNRNYYKDSLMKDFSCPVKNFREDTLKYIMDTSDKYDIVDGVITVFTYGNPNALFDSMCTVTDSHISNVGNHPSPAPISIGASHITSSELLKYLKRTTNRDDSGAYQEYDYMNSIVNKDNEFDKWESKITLFQSGTKRQEHDLFGVISIQDAFLEFNREEYCDIRSLSYLPEMFFYKGELHSVDSVYRINGAELESLSESLIAYWMSFQEALKTTQWATACIFH